MAESAKPIHELTFLVSGFHQHHEATFVQRVVENLLPGAFIDVWRPKRKGGRANLQGRLSITEDIAQRQKQFNQAAQGRTTPLRIGPLYLKVGPDPMCTPKKKRRNPEARELEKRME